MDKDIYPSFPNWADRVVDRLVDRVVKRRRNLHILLVWVTILIVGVWFMNNWTNEAHELAEDSFKKADWERWNEEADRRGDIGSWFILIWTGVAVVAYMVFGEESEESQETSKDTDLAMSGETPFGYSPEQ
jgi:hypothetical protein